MSVITTPFIRPRDEAAPPDPARTALRRREGALTEWLLRAFGLLTYVRPIDAGRAKGNLSFAETVDPGVLRRKDWGSVYKPANLGRCQST